MPRSALLPALAATLMLAGCSTFGMDFGSLAPTTPVGRAIDYRNDDLASAVFALEVPTTLHPVPGGTVASLDLAAGKDSRHIKANLVLTDGSAVSASLPPPAEGRTYVMLGFSDKDKLAVRAAQKWLRSLPSDAAPVAVLDVTPRLCETAAIDPVATTYSLIPALPGTPLTPLATNRSLAAAAGTTGGQIPPCAG